MAILKVGDWVLSDGEVGQITLLDFFSDGTIDRWHLVRVQSQSFAALRREKGMVKVDPAFHNLLTDVHKERGDD